MLPRRAMAPKGTVNTRGSAAFDGSGLLAGAVAVLSPIWLTRWALGAAACICLRTGRSYWTPGSTWHTHVLKAVLQSACSLVQAGAAGRVVNLLALLLGPVWGCMTHCSLCDSLAPPLALVDVFWCWHTALTLVSCSVMCRHCGRLVRFWC